MSLSQIYYSKPSITEKEISYATNAAANGWGSKCYEYINKFENMFKEYLNVNYTIATSSCTGALHMGLYALGIKAGDEVIAPDITWVATISPIIYLGATPILVDVNEKDWCIDTKKVEEAITEKTKAIIGVHIYGNLCNMDELLRISKKYNIPIIEDSAEGLGSIYKGRKAGSIGKFSAFSFHGTKTLTTGEGGMFATNDSELYNKILTLSNHGRNKNQYKQFWFDVIGFKYKMSNIQAAIGCAQMERIDELVSRKIEIFETYKQKLKDFPLRLNHTPKDCVNSYWMTTAIFDNDINFDREKLLKEFKDNNIDGRVFFYPLSLIFKDSADFNKMRVKEYNSVSYSIYNRAINLPCYHDINESDIDRVVDCIRRSI